MEQGNPCQMHFRGAQPECQPSFCKYGASTHLVADPSGRVTTDMVPGISAATDILYAALPVTVFWRLQMDFQTKRNLVIVMLFTCVTCACAIGKAVSVDETSPDFTCESRQNARGCRENRAAKASKTSTSAAPTGRSRNATSASSPPACPPSASSASSPARTSRRCGAGAAAADGDSRASSSLPPMGTPVFVGILVRGWNARGRR